LRLSIISPKFAGFGNVFWPATIAEIDKTIPNLKRVEVIIPARTLQNNKGWP
jgi:hypothetical protein